MELIVFPRKTVNETKSLAESTLELLKDFTELATPFNQASTAYTQFVTGLQKEQVTITEVLKLDDSRDNLTLGLLKSIKPELHYPYASEAEKTAVAELKKIDAKYSMKFVRGNRDEQTAELDNLLADLSKVNLSALTGNGIQRWIEPLTTAAAKYKEGALKYNKSKTDEDQILSASKSLPELKTALDGLLAFTYSNAMYGVNPQIKEAYQQIVTLYN